MKKIAALLIFIFTSSIYAQVFRFDKEQIKFVYQNNFGNSIECEHKLLSHVPWWRVNCGDREYTVDTWVQILENTSEDLVKLTLMFHASEGVASSGQKLVQFREHFTSFIVKEMSAIEALTSSLDMQNGQASLNLYVNPNK